MPNDGQEKKLILFRAPNGTLYLDNIGSYLLAEEPGERIEIQTAMGWKMVLFREPGSQPVQSSARAAAQSSSNMDRGGVGHGIGNDDIPSKIAGLKKLKDSGAITESEYEKKKRDLLERM